MKNLITIIIIACFIPSSAQKLKEYKAPNEITYAVGDTIQMGLPSGDSHFKFLQMPKAFQMVAEPGEEIGLPSTFANAYCLIKKIQKGGGIKPKTWLYVQFAKGAGKFLLDIDSAIEVGEVKGN